MLPSIAVTVLTSLAPAEPHADCVVVSMPPRCSYNVAGHRQPSCHAWCWRPGTPLNSFQREVALSVQA